jgi:hypothetical protein
VAAAGCAMPAAVAKDVRASTGLRSMVAAALAPVGAGTTDPRFAMVRSGPSRAAAEVAGHPGGWLAGGCVEKNSIESPTTRSLESLPAASS